MVYSVGIGPDGHPLPIMNFRKLYPRMYPCIIVNQDGSSYHIEHEYPHHIITLPLDKSTLSEEELMVSMVSLETLISYAMSITGQEQGKEDCSTEEIHFRG